MAPAQLDGWPIITWELLGHKSMVYYVPFIMNRGTFAWSVNVTIKTISPSAYSAFYCLTELHLIYPRKPGALEGGPEAVRSGGGVVCSNSENSLYCEGCRFSLNPDLEED